MSDSSANYAFASDNTAGICPEALAAIQRVNMGTAPSYGDDAHTTAAKRLFTEVFETACEVFFVFNGTAANALVFSALCQRHHAILCHEFSHAETDECGAPEFFTGGSKMLPLAGEGGKLRPGDLEPALHRGHGVHFPKVRALSITQATELGTVYTPEELRALTDYAHARGLLVHMDGARFANAAAAAGRGSRARVGGTERETGGPRARVEEAQPRTEGSAKRTLAHGVPPANLALDSLRSSSCADLQRHSPAELTWRAGVDVLCFGGTKNGMLTTEAIVFFNRELAREFEYRVKQSGQLSSKMRFASAQWEAVLSDGAWLRHGAHANRQAQALATGLRGLGFSLVAPTEANGVFVELAPRVVTKLETRGWKFHRFVGEQGYRLMCSWATKESDVAAFLADARVAKAEVRA